MKPNIGHVLAALAVSSVKDVVLVCVENDAWLVDRYELTEAMIDFGDIVGSSVLDCISSRSLSARQRDRAAPIRQGNESPMSGALAQ